MKKAWFYKIGFLSGNRYRKNKKYRLKISFMH